MLNLADASRLRGDLDAALSWGAEAERLATGDRLEDENFMWGKWAYPYLEVDGIDDPSQWKRVQVEMTDEKLAMIHYWAAITHAAGGDTEAAMESLGVAMNLSPRVDVHCVVHNRIDAMISRFDDREGMVGWLKSLADRLASRDVACVRA